MSVTGLFIAFMAFPASLYVLNYFLSLEGAYPPMFGATLFAASVYWMWAAAWKGKNG